MKLQLHFHLSLNSLKPLFCLVPLCPDLAFALAERYFYLHTESLPIIKLSYIAVMRRNKEFIYPLNFQQVLSS